MLDDFALVHLAHWKPLHPAVEMVPANEYVCHRIDPRAQEYVGETAASCSLYLIHHLLHQGEDSVTFSGKVNVLKLVDDQMYPLRPA